MQHDTLLEVDGEMGWLLESFRSQTSGRFEGRRS